MKTSDRSEVIQEEEQCRDGHYRAKLDLRTKTVTSTGADRAAELDPNDSTSLQAQNPTDLGDLRIGRASEEAAGIPAILNTMLYGIGEMGPVRSAEAFVKINQVTGFDCQSCACGQSPDKERKFFEFLREAGAKGFVGRVYKEAHRTGFLREVFDSGAGGEIRLLAQSAGTPDLPNGAARERDPLYPADHMVRRRYDDRGGTEQSGFAQPSLLLHLRQND